MTPYESVMIVLTAIGLLIQIYKIEKNEEA